MKPTPPDSKYRSTAQHLAYLYADEGKMAKAAKEIEHALKAAAEEARKDERRKTIE